ncbi:MAG: glycosyltransferase family 2 protein [Aquificota bacterium]|nr:MAG: glycosyltransferase family 2 protein [Aquificota bacterium]RLD99668.1 MAG: glycosyltransferase family 2 protein [Aquificota bacterium]
MREKLTVIVPTLNEEENLQACLESVAWADEIIVVDSGSTDATLEIAQSLADRILEHEYINSATQKNWAIPQATHPWVMIVDADERVTPELKKEIQRVLEAPKHQGYSIGRLNHFLGHPLRHGGWSPKEDRNIRLFMRDKGRYEDKEVHADVIVEGSVGHLRHPLIHYSYRSLDQYFRKMERYTRWAAMDIAKKGSPVKWHHVTLRPLGDFIKLYFMKLGFLDGFPGLIIALLSAYYVMVKYSRAWEIEKKGLDTQRANPVSRHKNK